MATPTPRFRHASPTLAATAALLLAGLLAAPVPALADQPFAIQILSSAPDQVSDGDALVRVQFEPFEIPDQATLLLNGSNVTSSLVKDPAAGTMEGVVSGMVVGSNLLQVKPHPNATSVLASLTVTNHPKQGPIFSGPHQQPFVCTTARRICPRVKSMDMSASSPGAVSCRSSARPRYRSAGWRANSMKRSRLRLASQSRNCPPETALNTPTLTTS